MKTHLARTNRNHFRSSKSVSTFLAAFVGIAVLVSVFVNIRAQADTQLLIEEFNYTAATALTANGWAAHNAAGTNPITVVTPGLTYAGYPSSGIGNAVSMTTSGEDDNKTFTPQTSGTIYAAAMVNVSAAQTTGDYFFHVFDGLITGNKFLGRVFAKKDPSSTNFAFGIQKGSTVNTVYTPGFTYAVGTTHLIVVKYTFVAGALNDTVDLFVDPILNGIEPSPTVTALVDTTIDAADIRGVALRQGSALNASTQQVDGIRVGTSWATATSIPVSLPHVTGPTATNITVPITVGDLTGQGVKAYDLQVTFDPTVVLPQGTPFDTAGTVSSTMLITPNATNPGQLIISAFQATDLTGSGTLINLKFMIIGAPGQVTTTLFQDYTDPGAIFHPGFRFNAGTPIAVPANGSIHVNGPTAASGTVSGRITDGQGLPVSGTVVRLNGAQSRKTISDANGNYHFDDVETDSFYTVTPSRANYSFSPFNRSFSQVGNKTDAVFTATSTGDDANPLDTAEYFVRQQYVDILGREPEEAGFNYWSDQILACGNDADCNRERRLNVSAAFFGEPEFQASGSFIYDVYAGALGRHPAFTEYVYDRQLVVGGANLESEKQAFAGSFVGRAEFLEKYAAYTTAESFVDALLANVQQTAGVDLAAQRTLLVARYQQGASQTQSRSLVVSGIADDATFKQAQYNAAFVLTEYFAYLRRDADQAGFDFWLGVLNNRARNNYRGMVCSFVTATEYQQRFSVVVTRGNSECN